MRVKTAPVRRAVAQRRVENFTRAEIFKRKRCRADVRHVAMRERKAVKPIHTACAQKLPDDVFVSCVVSAINQPVAMLAAQMHRATRAQVKHGDLARRMASWQLDEQVTAGQLREKMHK